MADVLLASYEELVSRWRDLSTPSREAHVNGFVLNYAYNSGKIENDAITYHDTHEVFESGRIIAFTGDVRTLFEIQNLKTSWEWARPLATPKLQLTEDLVLKAHELLTYGTYDEQRWESGERPGSYKLGDYVVGAKAVGADASDVPELMRDLLGDVSAYLSDDTRALTVAAYLHAVLVDIHPFADGNGRVARLLMNMVLLSMGHPPVVIREQDRMAYYGALDAFHDEGDLEPFKQFLMTECLVTWEGRL